MKQRKKQEKVLNEGGGVRWNVGKRRKNGLCNKGKKMEKGRLYSNGGRECGGEKLMGGVKGC